MILVIYTTEKLCPGLKNYSTGTTDIMLTDWIYKHN